MSKAQPNPSRSSLIGLVDAGKLKIGVVDPEPGKAAVIYTEEAGKMAMAGTIDAVVSAPLNKESMLIETSYLLLITLSIPFAEIIPIFSYCVVSCYQQWSK